MRKLHRVAIAGILAVTLSACAERSSSPQGGGGIGDTLTYGEITAPPTLNPALGDATYRAFYQLAYDSLLIIRPDGSYAPGLATKWGYVGADNRTFDLTLRAGVKFSDGQQLTADAVKKWLLYEKEQARQPAQILTSVKSIDVTGPLTVRINLEKSDPGMPYGLSQNFGGGYVASPAALANPSTLNTKSAGTGPYVVDPANTVAGDHYTYLPNPAYWNKSRVRWKKVVIRVIANPNSMVQALRAGQVQAARGDSSTITAARGAGLDVVTAPQLLAGLNLADRGGTLAKPLGDVRVRQALNHAVDRTAISKALYGDAGFPLSQYALKGAEGYDETLNNRYPYDPAKAKNLLAAAGYPDGFTLPVLTTPVLGQERLIQAMQGYLDKVGVRLRITSKATANEYLTSMASGKHPAITMTYGLSKLHALYTGFLNPKGPFNPFHTAEPELTSLYERYAAAPGSDAAARTADVNRYLVEHAWTVPVVGGPYVMFKVKGITGVELTGGNAAVPYILDVRRG